MSLTFANATTPAIALHVIEPSTFKAWYQDQTPDTCAWVDANGFTGAKGQTLLIPGVNDAPLMALAGYGTASNRRRGRFLLAAAAANLPQGVYTIASGLPTDVAEMECFGWLMNGYAFNRYHQRAAKSAGLVAPEGIDTRKIEIMAAAEVLTRDLINTPASDMGPDALQGAADDLARQHGASCKTIVGEDLLTKNLPMIHAVGRAAAIAPRLIDMRWGTAGPTLTLVGKGVCFDTGGLNLKPGASMGLMKKDMGGAATVLGLAHMIMALKLPLQLRVLIPAVENSVAGNAFRPQDILTSRKGLTVEINNTDAEGRLVLADALALADEDTPDLIVSMATLTGAARVAVGPDLAPFFVDSDSIAQNLSDVSGTMFDPIWRLPFHDPYESMIEPGIADLDNAPKSGFAGSTTAALFLRRFVTDTPEYLHFDIYGWNPTAAPARPKGGVGMGARTILAALPGILKL
ncbi:MAG: leucyl aminopeptidase [Paracoccaceae bacterium]|jgi:leucyl aminopeptidase